MMDLEKQVVSLGLAKKLKQLGVKQESFWYWEENPRPKHERAKGELDGILHSRDEIDAIAEYSRLETEIFSAFSVAELGELLKDKTNRFPRPTSDGFWEDTSQSIVTIIKSETEADARARLLIFLIEYEGSRCKDLIESEVTDVRQK